MSNLRQAAQQALRALERIDHPGSVFEFVFDEEIAALRAALAEPDSDYERGFVDGMNLQTKRSVDKAVNRMAQTTHWEGCEAVHPECRKPEQEPVAWAEEIIDDLHALYDTEMIRENDSGDALIRLDDAIACVEDAKQHYTAPTPRKPLTDEEIERACVPLGAAMLSFTEVARAIERAHGIGDNK